MSPEMVKVAAGEVGHFFHFGFNECLDMPLHDLRWYWKNIPEEK